MWRSTLACVLILGGLKIAGVLYWSWWWVLTPLWVALAVTGLGIAWVLVHGRHHHE